MTNKYLIARIIGNDISTIHGNNQTYNNLLFTLKNESKFKNTDKIFILNRIIDKKNLSNIIKLLKKYSYPYINIKFDYNEFKKIPKLEKNIISLCHNILHKKNFYVKENHCILLSNGLLNYKLYIMNINYARNICIKYGKSNGYEWTFALDSNSYFTEEYYNDIILNIEKETEYITIPQIRLSEGSYNNNDILKSPDKMNALRFNEHQLAFKNTSEYIFNENIPYGTMNKGEFLNALGVPGLWNSWIRDLERINIKQRKFENIKYQTLSKIIRLNPENKNNKRETNWINRFIGTYILIKKIINENKI
jgi:hypothetical protein